MHVVLFADGADGTDSEAAHMNDMRFTLRSESRIEGTTLLGDSPCP